jgi:GAF domain-containing protein
MSGLTKLAEQWRQDADAMRRHACEQIATVIERHVAELEAATRAEDAAPLTLEQAARESGYSVDRLRHMITEQRIPNAGRKGAPRVRRQDLPRKAPRSTGFDPRAAAQRTLKGGTT